MRQSTAITDNIVYRQKFAADHQIAPVCCLRSIIEVFCNCVAFRLNPQNAIDELDLSWRREIMTLACKPRLLSLHTDIGLKRGLAFVVNPALPAYAPLLSFETTVKIVANAAISMGCAKNISMTPLKVCRLATFVTINWKKLAAAVQQRVASRYYFRYRLMALCYAAVAEW